MGEPRPIEEIIALAERRWPGLELRRKSTHEACGPCPICRQATTDGFVVFEDSGYLCRKCGAKGWIDENDPHPPSREQLLEIRVRALERKQEEHERRLTALEQMARCKDHVTYHQMLDDDDREYWHSQGMLDATIDKYLLGICYSCPTDSQHRPSYTIPVINGGKLVNIRHRLVTDSGDRYRPHAPGLGATLFNADNVYADAPEIMVVEGEKKSLVVGQYGFLTVGTMGKAGFQPAWAKRFDKFKRVLVALDPDAEDQAQQVAGLFGGRGWVVPMPCKPDDLFTKYHGTPAMLQRFVELARRIH